MLPAHHDSRCKSPTSRTPHDPEFCIAPRTPFAPQAWLSSVETVTGAGLGAEYYDTRGRALAGVLLGVAALVALGAVSHMTHLL